jgi:hypothetical protein
VSVGNTATIVHAANAAHCAVTVQNQSTSIVFCATDASVTTASYGITLAAGTVAANGTGPGVLYQPYGGLVYCIVAAGTANVSFQTMMCP